MAVKTITTTGTIVNCFNIKNQGLTALLLVEEPGKRIERHCLLVLKGLDVKPLRTSKTQFPAMKKVQVTYTINETTGTEMLTAYTIISSPEVHP